MPNSVDIQILNDGPANVTLKVSGELTVSDLAQQVLVDPALLGYMQPNLMLKASRLRITRINFDVEDGLALNLLWDAPTPVQIWSCTGRGEVKAKEFGGLTNDAISPTGKILISTQGWATGSTSSFNLVLELRKA